MTANKGNANVTAPMSLPAGVDTSLLLRRLMALHPRKIDLSLARIERLLAALGNPHDALPPVVHVAGTNGKGSVIALLRAILEAAGLRVHVYTSPHLVRFHERIRLGDGNGGRLISDAELASVLTRAEAANGEDPITFFEITTAAAFLAFAETPADVVLLETGLGGRLDATNVVRRPAITVITPVSIDHVDFLGGDLAGIAREKAGILKPDVPCVLAPQEPAAALAIEARAAEIGAPVLAAGRQWDAYEQHGRLVYQTESAVMDLGLPRLKGRHQIVNAGTAVTVALNLLAERGPRMQQILEEGLMSATWPARLELLGPGPLSQFAGEAAELWLDGGHNPAAAAALAQSMADIEDRVPRPLHVIVGMLRSKDAAGFFSHFKGLAEWVATVPLPGEHSFHAPDELARIAQAAGLPAEPAQDVPHALSLSRQRGTAPPRILICGSLYLAGQVLDLHRMAPT